MARNIFNWFLFKSYVRLNGRGMAIFQFEMTIAAGEGICRTLRRGMTGGEISQVGKLRTYGKANVAKLFAPLLRVGYMGQVRIRDLPSDSPRD